MARPENDHTGIRKLSMVGKKTYTISIPIEIIKQLNWKKGDTMLVRRIGNKISIERKD